MNVVVASTFRDSTGHLDRYLDQAHRLLATLEQRGDTVTFLWGEGDSTDDTAAHLRNVLGPISLVDVSTGNRYFPSAEDSEARWANVAQFCNQLLDHLPEHFDVLLWVESDLIWQPDTLLELIDQAPLLGVVAAPVWMGERFYDTWGTTINGEPFTPTPRDGLQRVSSSAGCLAIRADIASEARFSPVDAVRGWCAAMGGVWLDTGLKVEHPC